MYIVISTEYCEGEVTNTYVGSYETKEDAANAVAKCRENLRELIEGADDLIGEDADELGYYCREDDGYTNVVSTFDTNAKNIH